MNENGRPTILHWVDSWGPGGAETVFLDLVTHLDPESWDCHAAVLREGWVSEALRERGREPIILPSHRPSFDLRHLAGVSRTLGSLGVDLLHAHLFGAGMYGALAGAWRGVPVVCTLHGEPDLPLPSRGASLRYRVLGLGTTRVVCVSESLSRTFLERSRFRENRVEVIHNGVDLEAIRSVVESSEPPGSAGQDIVVGTIANFRPAKALDVFVRAAGLLMAKNPRYRFRIAGEPAEPITSQLLDLRDELGLGDRLELMGFRSDAARILSEMDVYVCSSDTEGFSLSTVEAMAAGVPVVATRSGGPEEIIRDGVDGILVPTGSPESIASAVDSIVADSESRRRIVSNADARVTERFSMKAMVGAYDRLYRSVLAARKGVRAR